MTFEEMSKGCPWKLVGGGCMVLQQYGFKCGESMCGGHHFAKQMQKPERWGCYCDLGPSESPDGCVLDYAKPEDCIYALDLVEQGKSREDCPYWRKVEE